MHLWINHGENIGNFGISESSIPWTLQKPTANAVHFAETLDTSNVHFRRCSANGIAILGVHVMKIVESTTLQDLEFKPEIGEFSIPRAGHPSKRRQVGSRQYLFSCEYSMEHLRTGEAELTDPCTPERNKRKTCTCSKTKIKHFVLHH